MAAKISLLGLILSLFHYLNSQVSTRNMESLIGRQNKCARTDTVFVPLSEVSTRAVTLAGLTCRPHYQVKPQGRHNCARFYVNWNLANMTQSIRRADFELMRMFND